MIMANRSLSLMVCICTALVSVTQASAGGCRRAHPAPNLAPSTGEPLELFGTVSEQRGDWLTIATRTGKQVTLDATPALKAQESTILLPGRSVDILGTRGATGVLYADVISRAKGGPTAWPPDCAPVQ